MTTLQLETRRAPFAPASFNPDTRTIEAVISTGADVQRVDARGPYIERLDTAAIDLASLAGIVVLDGHRQTGSEHVVGSVLSARREGIAIVATIRLSAAEDVRSTVLKVEEGILRGVSVGYAVARWNDSTDPQTKARVRTAANWTIKEVSLVGIPADPASHIRSDDAMTIQTTAAETVAPPAAVAVETRAAQIRSIAERANLDSAWADAQIDSSADVQAVRAAAFDAMITRNAASTIRTATVGASNDDPAAIRERHVEALAARLTGAAPSEAARPFMGWGLTDYARDSLTRSGASGVTMLGREELLTRAMHTTSDFASLLTGAGQRVLEPAYRAAESPLKQLARQRTADDFRPISLIKLGEFSPLQKVTESGEVKALTVGEAAEGYSLETLAGIFNLSRKALINDDLGAFARWGEMMGQAAAQAEADQLIALLLQASGAGPVMGDGVRLFHADHGNLAGTPSALSVESLSAARLAMRMQKGLDGKTPVAVAPKFLLVAPDIETTAEQILAELNAATVSDQNPFAGKLTLLVDPRLTAKSWYVFADPAISPVLEYAYLSSAQGPQLASRDGWDVLGREFRVILDFGAGAVDHRGAYRNAGA